MSTILLKFLRSLVVFLVASSCVSLAASSSFGATSASSSEAVVGAAHSLSEAPSIDLFASRWNHPSWIIDIDVDVQILLFLSLLVAGIVADERLGVAWSFLLFEATAIATAGVVAVDASAVARLLPLSATRFDSAVQGYLSMVSQLWIPLYESLVDLLLKVTCCSKLMDIWLDCGQNLQEQRLLGNLKAFLDDVVSKLVADEGVDALWVTDHDCSNNLVIRCLSIVL